MTARELIKKYNIELIDDGILIPGILEEYIINIIQDNFEKIVIVLKDKELEIAHPQFSKEQEDFIASINDMRR